MDDLIAMVAEVNTMENRGDFTICESYIFLESNRYLAVNLKEVSFQKAK